MKNKACLTAVLTRFGMKPRGIAWVMRELKRPASVLTHPDYANKRKPVPHPEICNVAIPDHILKSPKRNVLGEYLP